MIHSACQVWVPPHLGLGRSRNTGLPSTLWWADDGVEAAIHATRSAFESEECEAPLLDDATNAFNALNHQVALHNIR